MNIYIHIDLIIPDMSRKRAVITQAHLLDPLCNVRTRSPCPGLIILVNYNLCMYTPTSQEICILLLLS